MASCEDVSLRLLFARFMDTEQAVFIKNIPERATPDGVQCFVEVILKAEVIAMHWPQPGLKGCCIAVVDIPIKDLTGYKRELQDRKLEGEIIEFSPLRKAKGLFIRDVPEDLSDEFMRLYFESPRSSGEEDCISDLKSCDCCMKRMVAVVIKNKCVIKRILDQSSHPILEKHGLQIDPYFPVLHDLLLVTHQEDVQPSSQGAHTCSSTSTKVTIPTADPRGTRHLKDTGGGVSQEWPRAVQKDFHGEILSQKVYDYGIAQRDIAKSDKRNIQNTKVLSQQKGFSADAKFTEKAERPPKPSPSYLKSTKLRIFSEKAESIEHTATDDNSNSCNRTNSESNSETFFCHESAESLEDTLTEELLGSIKLSSLPDRCSKTYQSHPRNSNTEGKFHTRSEHVSAGDTEKTSTIECSSAKELPKHKIVLLKVNKFSQKCGSCKVTLIEKQGRVKFDGDREPVELAKIKMYETLNNVQEVRETLPEHHLICISESYGYIRNQLIKKKIGAVIETDIKQCILQSFAFSVQEAQEGLKFVIRELVSGTITIRDGQLECLNGSEWDSILHTLQKNDHVRVHVLEKERKVEIVAFRKESVSQARQKVISYLKESAQKSMIEVEIELKGASARCFSHFFLENLKNRIRVQNQDAGSLKLIVTGDRAFTQHVHDKVKQMWHEKIDFKKITSDGTELWLLMKGLSTSRAKDFLDKFERDHSCFIDLNKDGHVPPPPVTVKRIEKTSSDEYCLQSHHVEEEDYFRGTDQLEKRSSKAEELQLGLSDEEAFKMIIEESKSATTLAQPHPRFSRNPKLSRDSDRSSSHQMEDEIYASDQLRLRYHNANADKAKEFQGDLPYEEAMKRAIEVSESESSLSRPLFQRSRSYTTGDIGAYDNRTDLRKDFSHSGANSGCSFNLSESSPVFMPRQRKEHCRQFGNVIVTVKLGFIATEQTRFRSSAKVNILSPSRDIKRESVVSKSFVEAGGSELVEAYEIRKYQSESNIIVTQGCGRTNCDFIFHVTLKKSHQNPETVIAPLMRECFSLCSSKGCNYIGFPPLGVGRLYKYPATLVAKCMLDEILQHTQIPPFMNSLREISVVIYDEETYGVFESALQQASHSDSQPGIASPFYHTVRQRPITALTGIPMRPSPDPAHQQFSTRQAAVTPAVSPGQRNVLRPEKALAYNTANQLARRSPLDHTRASQGSPPSRKPIPSRPSNYGGSESISVRAKGTRNVEETRRTNRNKLRERSPDEPAAKYVVKIFTQDKLSCERARNELGQQLKRHFLFEKKLERRGKLSDSCKKKIRDILRRRNVKSCPASNSNGYIIKGEEMSVNDAYADILKTLLDENQGHEISVENKRARRKELQRRPEEFVKHMAFDHEPETPANWKNFKPGSPISAVFTIVKKFTKNFIKEKLDTDDPVYIAISKLIKKTWDGSIVGQGKDARGLESLKYDKMCVTKIQRVENLILFQKYSLQRKDIFLKMHRRKTSNCTPISGLPGSDGSSKTEGFQRRHMFDGELFREVNEHFFFHGTTADIVDAICDDGFDNRLGSQQAMYGAGVYGAESPTKADQYADSKKDRSKNGKKMFLIRMVLGESYLCSKQDPPKFRRPPCSNMKCLRDDCSEKSHGRFDSVIGQSGRLFREFVVYHANQCYPEYIISYDRV